MKPSTLFSWLVELSNIESLTINFHYLTVVYIFNINAAF